MTMKNKILIFFAAAFLAAVSTGCSVNEEGIYGSFPYLEIEIDSKNITKVASNEGITVRTNRSLTVTVDAAGASWLAASVEGDQVVLTWKENTLETTREAVVTVSTPNSLVTKEIKVIQDASGELTIQDDLILRSKTEIEKNTYTKTTGNLIIGNVTNVVTKAVSNSVSVDLGNKVYTASSSDISDADMEVVKEQIHMIGGKKIVVVNTNVRTFPIDLMAANGVDELYFDFNDMSALPSAELMESLELKKLSLRGNKISDISALSGCSTIESLDISGNDVYDLSPIAEMETLETVVLDDLPLTQTQLEIFMEKNPDLTVKAEDLRTEDSPLPLFGNMEITVLSETQVQIAVPLLNNVSDLSTVGFYIGNKRELDKMTFNDASLADGVLSMLYDVETLENVIYYVRAYAENAAGGNYSPVGYFGSMTSEEDIYIASPEELQDFYDQTYSHVNGSVFVGKTSTSGSSDIKLDDGRYSMYFRSTDMSDLTKLGQLVYVRDGLYIGNVGLKNLNQIAHIEGMRTLWLRGNKFTTVPDLACAETLTYLDVSLNELSDFAFLDKLPAVDTLYLGSSDKPKTETNDIGVIDGLAKYPGLKFVDLSGLPLHEWQVEELKAAMPETEIVFTSGGRDPFIPTVKANRVTRSGNSVTMNATVSSEGNSDIIEYGFYYGKNKEDLAKAVVGQSIETGATFSHSVEVTDLDMYYWYPYAVNSYGETRCDFSEFTLAYEDLSQSGTANCYLIQTPGKYKFNATVRGNSLESVGASATAEIVWEFKNPDSYESFISSVALKDGYVEFEVVEGAEYGNALIAVKNANGTILWSWHIWLCDFDPETSAYRAGNGILLMDRNLGATMAEVNNEASRGRASGMLYQWGRKDPFNRIVITHIRAYYGSVEDTFAEPTYITQNWTWLDNGNGVRGLWSPSRKTTYDPCPPGWKVPDKEAWDGASVYDYNDYSVRVRHTSDSDPVRYPYAPWYDSNFNYYEGYQETHTWTSFIPDNEYWSPTGVNLYSWGIDAGGRNNSDALAVRCMKDIGLVVTTTKVTPGADKVTLFGNIRSEGTASVTERGFVMCSKNQNPTLEDATFKVAAGAGTGDFSAQIDELQSETDYWVRAYAVGDGVTRYSDVLKVRTTKSGTGGDDFTEDDYVWE